MAEPADAVGASPERNGDAATESPATILVICSSHTANQEPSKSTATSKQKRPWKRYTCISQGPSIGTLTWQAWQSVASPWPWVAWSASSCSRLKCRRSPWHSFRVKKHAPNNKNQRISKSTSNYHTIQLVNIKESVNKTQPLTMCRCCLACAAETSEAGKLES